MTPWPRPGSHHEPAINDALERHQRALSGMTAGSWAIVTIGSLVAWGALALVVMLGVL